MAMAAARGTGLKEKARIASHSTTGWAQCASRLSALAQPICSVRYYENYSIWQILNANMCMYALKYVHEA